MKIIHKVAGLSYSTADKIRKVIGKKRDAKEFKPFEDAFIQGCLQMKTLSENEAREFWVGLQESAHYLFNRSHSIEYAIVGYWTSYVKYYFPTEFICASLTCGSDSKKNETIKEAYRLGLRLVLPNVETSDPIRWVARDKTLYTPLIEIKGVGEKLAEQHMSKMMEKKKASKGFFLPINITLQAKENKLDKILSEIERLIINKNIIELSKYFSFPIQL